MPSSLSRLRSSIVEGRLIGASHVSDNIRGGGSSRYAGNILGRAADVFRRLLRAIHDDRLPVSSADKYEEAEIGIVGEAGEYIPPIFSDDDDDDVGGGQVSFQNEEGEISVLLSSDDEGEDDEVDYSAMLGDMDLSSDDSGYDSMFEEEDEEDAEPPSPLPQQVPQRPSWLAGLPLPTAAPDPLPHLAFGIRLLYLPTGY